MSIEVKFRCSACGNLTLPKVRTRMRRKGPQTKLGRTVCCKAKWSIEK